MPAAPINWTTKELLNWMSGTFKDRAIDSPRLCAELLLSHVLGCDRMRLYMDADRPTTPEERETLRGLVGRTLKHEPVQYLVGEAWFFGLPMHVDRRVLIPRPATETIVEHALQHLRRAERAHEAIRIADVCTGSGCVAIALAKQLPKAELVATDISDDALEVARLNAERHGVADRIDFRAGNLLEPLQRERFGLIVANPPYIPDREWDDVAPNVRDHEPTLALRGGSDGLDLVRPLLAGAPAHAEPGAWVLVEAADSNALAALELVRTTDAYASAEVLDDFEGLPRVVAARVRG